MTDQSHTPLSLSVEESVPSDGFDCFWIKDANGTVVGDVYGPQRSRQQQELASAIVRSVNSAPSLVKALEEIASEVGRMVGAVEAVARHQEQCDEDGVMVKVSRQAVDELASAFEFINNASRAALTAYRGEGK